MPDDSNVPEALLASPAAVRNWIDHGPTQEFAEEMLRLAESDTPGSVRVLQSFLTYRDSGLRKHWTPHIASMALLQKGPAGVAALLEVLPFTPGSIYPTAVLASLWRASQGDPVPPVVAGSALPPRLLVPLPDSTRAAADSAFRELVAQSFSDESLLQHLVQLLWQQAWVSEPSVEGRASPLFVMLTVLSQATIRISQLLVSQFKDLVQEGRREEEYQQFLSANPVFIDPLALRIVPKHRLGADYITDFVLQRSDGRYIVVEIEKPQDRLFTGRGDFSATFSHALGQVVDFQEWVASNVAYARTHLPGVSSPQGLLVMGRDGELNEQNRAKLRRFNANSRAVEVVTYDDLLRRAQLLYANIHSPTVQ